MASDSKNRFSRRERQIMEIVYQLGKATVSDVIENLPDPPSYSAVRATMRLLKEKGHLNARQDGPRHVFIPVISQNEARSSALKNMLKTFFGGSAERAVAALLTLPNTKLSEEEMERLQLLLEKARNEDI